MKLRPHVSTRTDTLFPYTTLCRSPAVPLTRAVVIEYAQFAHGVDCQRGYLVSEFTALQLDDQLRHAARLSPKAVRKDRSEEHTSELQSLMRNSYAVFCLKKKKKK